MTLCSRLEQKQCSQEAGNGQGRGAEGSESPQHRVDVFKADQQTLRQDQEPVDKVARHGHWVESPPGETEPQGDMPGWQGAPQDGHDGRQAVQADDQDEVVVEGLVRPVHGGQGHDGQAGTESQPDGESCSNHPQPELAQNFEMGQIGSYRRQHLWVRQKSLAHKMKFKFPANSTQTAIFSA